MNLEPPEDWQLRYSAKIASAGAAVQRIPPHKRILIGSGAAEPGALVEAMVAQGTHLEGNEVVHLMTLGRLPTSSRSWRIAFASEEAHILLIEPTGTPSTGDRAYA